MRSALASLLRDFISDRTERLLFGASSGCQLLQANSRQDSLSLHPIVMRKPAYVGENMVDVRGLEPLTSSLRTRRSPN